MGTARVKPRMEVMKDLRRVVWRLTLALLFIASGSLVGALIGKAVFDEPWVAPPASVSPEHSLADLRTKLDELEAGIACVSEKPLDPPCRCLDAETDQEGSPLAERPRCAGMEVWE